jgi:hypothetical protein
VVAAIVFILEKKSVIDINKNVLYFCITIAFVYVNITSHFYKSFDPLIPFENLISSLLFGGILDALRRAQNQSADTSTISKNDHFNKFSHSFAHDSEFSKKSN